jgi:hypothetical protein
MKRSVGVTVIAVLSLLGSALVLAMGILMAVTIAMAFSSPMPQTEVPIPPAFFKAIMVIVPLFYLLPAVWGIFTGIGLLRLKNWARISIIVFSVLLIVFGVFGAMSALIFVLMPIPNMPNDDVGQSVMTVVRIFMVAFALAEVGVGIWWLVFFNRAKVKSQFVSPQALFPAAVQYQAADAAQPPPVPQVLPAAPLPTSNAPVRPLSITIIGWYLIVVSLFIPAGLIMRAPAVAFTLLLTGWQAVVYTLAMTAVLVYVGVGLLRLKPAARLVGIGYCVYSALNSGVFFLAPGAKGRMGKILEFQQSMFPWMKSWQEAYPIEFDLTPFMIIGAVGGMVLLLVLMYFLVTARQAFQRPVGASPA